MKFGEVAKRQKSMYDFEAIALLHTLTTSYIPRTSTSAFERVKISPERDNIQTMLESVTPSQSSAANKQQLLPQSKTKPAVAFNWVALDRARERQRTRELLTQQILVLPEAI